MGKTATNLSIVLGLITVAFAGYYLYTQRAASTLEFTATGPTTQNMLQNTRVFIEHRQTLDAIELDIGFFEDPRLLSLQSFTTPIQTQPVGRPDPFATPARGSVSNF